MASVEIGAVSNAEADVLAEGLEADLIATFSVLEEALAQLLSHASKEGWTERRFIDEATRLIEGSKKE